ncbi:hypothetical protein ACF0H5_011302 [Mactra antiquata]
MDGSDIKSHLKDDGNITDPDNDKVEDELPSDSRFFLWSEHESSSNNGMTTSIDYNKPFYIPYTKNYETTFGSEIFECNLSEETKMYEDRERQLGAMRKRARHLKDQAKKGKTITLDMKDKNLERIVAAIADVCELEVNVSGKPEDETSDVNDSGAHKVPACEFIEKAERAAMIMKRDNNALAAKVDQAEREKTKNELVPIHISKDFEVGSTPENLVGVLREISRDINNEKRRNEELKRRLSVIEAPPRLGTIQEEPRVILTSTRLSTIQEEPSLQSVGKETLASVEVGSTEHSDVNVVHISCLSPFCKLPPIVGQNNEQTIEKSVEDGEKVMETKATSNLKRTKSSKEQAQKSSVDITSAVSSEVVVNKCEQPSRMVSANERKKPQANKTSNCSPKHSLPVQSPQRVNRSRIPRWRRRKNGCMATDSANRSLATIAKAGTKDDSQTLSKNTKADINNNGHSMSLMTKEVRIRDDGQSMLHDFIGTKKPEIIPIYVRKYRINRRSRSVNHHTVSPTAGTAMTIWPPSDIDDTSTPYSF